MNKQDKIFKDKMDFLAKAENLTDRDVARVQRLLMSLMETEFFGSFETKNGVVTNSAKNIQLIGKIDRLFDRIRNAITRDVLKGFVATIMQTATFNVDYFIASGFESKAVKGILKDKVNLERLIGITPTGRVKKGGYIHRLTQARGPREQIKNYVLKSLASDTPFVDFQLGMKNLIIGSPKGRKKAVVPKGVLQKYFDQYAYDAYNQYDEVSNKALAVDLGLKHFIYEGSEILTSRAFCKKRIGKPFSVKETKKWKNDPTLIDQKNKATYNPLIERGRYRCRHFIKYISKQLYDELTK